MFLLELNLRDSMELSSKVLSNQSILEFCVCSSPSDAQGPVLLSSSCCCFHALGWGCLKKPLLEFWPWFVGSEGVNSGCPCPGVLQLLGTPHRVPELPVEQPSKDYCKVLAPPHIKTKQFQHLGCILFSSVLLWGWNKLFP